MQAEKNNNVTVSIKSLKDIYPITISDQALTPSNDDFIDAMRYSMFNYTRCCVPRLSCEDIIDRVIFNDPATIIFWVDGSKTVVKRSNDDVWDPEKGFCMAVMKKIFGKTSFIKKYTEEDSEPEHFMSAEEAIECLKNFGNSLKGGK